MSDGSPDNTGDLLILSPDVPARPSLAKELAYGPGAGYDAVGSDNAYRSERGLPFLRAGKLVVATPQFKGLTIYSPSPSNQQVATPVPANSAVGVTANPTTNSLTYVVVPEMLVSVTTSGGRVLVVVALCWQTNNNATGGNLAIFRDGVQVSTTYIQVWASNGDTTITSLNYLDNPPAGAHTYDLRWAVRGVNTVLAQQIARSIQAIELQVGSSPSTAIAIPTKV